MEFTAAADALVSDNKDVTLVGMAVDAPNGKVESPKFTVSIDPPEFTTFSGSA